VIDDSLKRYANYSPESPAQYAKDIMKTIATVLPAWMQFRDTVTEVKLPDMEVAAA